MRALPHNLISSQRKAPPRTSMALGVRMVAWESWADTNIQTIALSVSVVSMVFLFMNNWVTTLRDQCHWKKIFFFFCNLHFLRGEVIHHAKQGQRGITSVSQEAEKWEWKAYVKAFIGVSAGKARQGRMNSLGGFGVVPSCLVPAPWFRIAEVLAWCVRIR